MIRAVEPQPNAAPEVLPKPKLPDHVDRRFSELNDAINGGDQKAARELLALCEEYPLIWRRLGDLQVQTEESWVRTMAPGETDVDQFHRYMLRSGAEQRRKDLARDGNSALERLLIDRIVSAYLQVTFTELRYAQGLKDPHGTIERSEFWQKSLDRAQRQLLRATKALADVRRLIAPAQVNIGQHQINVVS